MKSCARASGRKVPPMFAEFHGTIGVKPSEQNAAVHVVDGVLIGDTSAAANRLPRCTACAPAEQPRNGSKPPELPEPKTRTNPNKSEQIRTGFAPIPSPQLQIGL